jgi:hypothetical protein
LRGGERTRQLFREIGQYAVPIHLREVERMRRIGVVEMIAKDDNEVFLINEAYYNESYGVELSPDGALALFS